jgi:hypothetical protein
MCSPAANPRVQPVQPPSNVQKWGAFAAERPELAERGSAMLVCHGLAHIGTVSRLGRPRVTPRSGLFSRLGRRVAAAPAGTGETRTYRQVA